MPGSKWAAAQATHARVQRCRDLLKAIGEAIEPYADRAAAGPEHCRWDHAGAVGEVRLRLQQILESLRGPLPEMVPAEDACPVCRERHTDMLICIEAGEEVRCFNCGTTYTPRG